MKAKVMEVTHVGVVLTRSLPPVLVVTAQGKVNTSGWSGGELSPYVYVTEPKDGIWDFDFIAERPGGIVQQVISDIRTQQPFAEVLPKWCKGVRVHAATNCIEQMLDGTDGRALFGAGDPGDAWPWTAQG